MKSKILRIELPLLTLVTAFAAWQIWDGTLSRYEAYALLGVFFVLVGWSIYQGTRGNTDSLAIDIEESEEIKKQPVGKSVFWLVTGLVLLVISSDRMVWGAVEIARTFGLSDHLIGLTIIALGTSLPELAASITAVRKNEHDLALGNVIGSNLFNTLAVVGIAGAIHPMAIEESVIQRDMIVMFALTLSLFVFGYGFKKQGRINRVEAAILITSYIAYTSYLVATQVMK